VKKSKKKAKIKFKLPKTTIVEPERTILTVFNGVIERKTISEINRILDKGRTK